MPEHLAEEIGTQQLGESSGSSQYPVVRVLTHAFSGSLPRSFQTRNFL